MRDFISSVGQIFFHKIFVGFVPLNIPTNKQDKIFTQTF